MNESVTKHLATILNKVQGVINAETNQEIDIGYEVMRIRDLCKQKTDIATNLVVPADALQSVPTSYLPTQDMELRKFGSITRDGDGLLFCGFNITGDGNMCPQETIIRLCIKRLIDEIEEFRLTRKDGYFPAPRVEAKENV